MVISKTREKVLRLFLKNPVKEYNIREISKETELNYRLSYQEVMKLKNEGIITISKRGMVNLCRINLRSYHPLYSYIEYLRMQELQKKHHKVKVIFQELKKLSTEYFTALVFGSYSSGEEREKSDLDLLFILPEETNRQQFEIEVNNILGMLSYRLDINVISEKGFLDLKKKKNLNIAQEVMSNHILLKGAEEYYELISNDN